MANPDHLNILKKGVQEWNVWRNMNPDIKPDLSETVLKKADLSDANLSDANLQEANLRGANLGRANLQEANLQEANLGRANLQEANLQEANLQEADLGRANLKEANLRDANLRKADLREANLLQANLLQANLQEANLGRANLQEANLLLANLANSTWYRSVVDKTDFTFVMGLHLAKRLEETIIEDPRNNALNTRTLEMSASAPTRFDGLLSWERITLVGRLPLFATSYAVLIFIPVFFYVLALYNSNVTTAMEWAEVVAQDTENPYQRVAQAIDGKLDQAAIPAHTLLLLVSTLFLAAASTIYAFRCPSRIKEFTKDQWCDQHKNALIHYWPISWSRPKWRAFCAAFYVIGGAGSLIYIVIKILGAGRFILENSGWSWYRL